MTPQNILVIRPRFLGDVILATGMAGVLKDAFPGVRVTLLAQAPFTEVLRHHPDWDGWIPFDASRGGNPLYLLRFFRDLRRGRFDTVLDLFGNPRTVQMALFSGARIRVGYRLKGRSWVYTHLAAPSSLPLPSGRRPVTEAYLDQIRVLGAMPGAPYRTGLRVTEAEREAARAFLAGQGWGGEPVAAVAPGASWPAKRWHGEKFIAVATSLLEKGVRPMFIFGPAEAPLKDYFRARWVRGFLKAEDLPLRMLFALVAESKVLLSNDSGPMHVGPAVGTPTLGIFGPGEPEIWFPYPPPHAAMHREISCSHCGLDDCGRLDCMTALQPEAVLDRLLTMIVA